MLVVFTAGGGCDTADDEEEEEEIEEENKEEEEEDDDEEGEDGDDDVVLLLLLRTPFNLASFSCCLFFLFSSCSVLNILLSCGCKNGLDDDCASFVNKSASLSASVRPNGII